MWINNNIFAEDLKNISSSKYIEWNRFYNKTIFITGATGLIGYTLASSILYYEKQNHKNIKVIALVRDVKKASEKFKEQIKDGCSISFIEGSVEQFPLIKEPIDFIIHGACPTISSLFSNNPVEIITTILDGTQNILKLAKEKKIEGCVFLSSMEVYGEIFSKDKLPEEMLGSINILSPRSSYPEGKRMAELICASYHSEYNVPVCTARLAQTFGPGISIDDNRVFGFMMRSAVSNINIELKADGKKENMYLYTADAATGILVLLTKGEGGKSYNVANDTTYCSVKDMGQLVLDTFEKRDLKVLTNVGAEEAKKLYPPNSFMRLDTTKLKNLGWNAEIGLKEMYLRMYKSIEEEKNK